MQHYLDMMKTQYINFALGWILFIGLFAFSTAPVSAQGDFQNPVEYEIGNIKVKGAVFSDENTVIAVSGLVVGQKIKVPGTEIQRAIKALWELRLFTDVEIYISKKLGDVVIINIDVDEKRRLTRYDFMDAKKNHLDDLKSEARRFLLKGGVLTEDIKQNTQNILQKYYSDRGYLDCEVKLKEVQDENLENGVKLEIYIDRGNRIKIKDIVFTGNENLSARKLRKVMKKTRRKRRIFAGSKLVQVDYDEDKRALTSLYNNIGHRDARIISDSIWRVGDKGHLMVQINLEEGKKYYFRNITFKGNSIYTDEQLATVMNIQKGEIYNQELLDTRLNFSQDGRDVSSLYMDDGYLFFNLDPVEKAIDGDSIDLEIRMFEGPQATIDRIIINGNDRTHEHVVRRELRTRPGQKFSRSDIIRSQREIVNLGYFNPETLGVNPIPNLQRGTVDIEYTVEEKSSDQLELSAGWGGRGRGVIGTLGVTFNNFSIRNIFKKEAWSPLPQGDGQRLSIRAQTNGRFYQSYNFSFTEPWLGGKKPNALTFSAYYSLLTNGGDRETDSFQSLGNLGASIGLGTRLKVPDDFFVSTTTIGIQSYNLRNALQWGFALSDGTRISDGRYNNLSLSQTISRNSIDNPIFPTSGARITLTGTFTLPYSLFRKDNSSLSLEDRLKWVEYHKWRLNVEWYSAIVGKLTLKVGAKFGILGYYNKEVGLTPFERFELGGDGISNQFVGIAGRDIISSRGYDVENFDANSGGGGASVFNKLQLELRYPISLNPSATVYVLGFFDGYNAWNELRDYNPLELRRSAGLGVRVFLPMFGTLGFDYGFGFDKDDTLPRGTKWTEYGRFNIILGFEPE